MTKSVLATSISAILLLGACGSGEQPAAPPTAQTSEVLECLKKDKVPAQADRAGATLVRAPQAKEAIVAKPRANTVNILFFAVKDEAQRVKEQVGDEDRVDIEETTLVVYEKAPQSKVEETVKDCLPEKQAEE
jgi:hypothetical protein